MLERKKQSNIPDQSFVTLQTINLMITNIYDTKIISNLDVKIKSLTQKSYDKFIKNIDFHKLTCSCGRSGQLVKHGYYKRNIKNSYGKTSITILRVRCKSCGKTHAIFPECIVPYSQILLCDHISIINAYNTKSSFDPIMIANESIDESNIFYIIKQYLKHWKERIASFKISLDLSISKQCLKNFKRQFMQIKCIPNILFSQNHIT